MDENEELEVKDESRELVLEDDNVDDVTSDETTEESGESMQPTEEVKTYTQEELDKILGARTDSLNRKHQKELAKYRGIESTLKQGLNLDNLDDVQRELKKFYRDNGVDIKDDVNYRDEREEKILAKAEAAEIISLGEEEMKRTANELATKQRTLREQEVFMEICEELTKGEAKRELKKRGVDESVIDSDNFKKFASKFNATTSLVDIYDIYSKTNGNKRKQPSIVGSMKNSEKGTELKDFYTPEEARKFTVKDFDKNPELFKRIEQSMSKWKK